MYFLLHYFAWFKTAVFVNVLSIVISIILFFLLLSYSSYYYIIIIIVTTIITSIGIDYCIIVAVINIVY